MGGAVYEFEPDEETILAKLLPQALAIQVYRSLLESAAGEHGARMSAMDNATRNAGDMIKRLSQNYNRARQARITWTPLVDGEPFATELRADYLVEADGELLVAEVKKGEEAPSLATAATRRQLLEYRVAFEADGVLLVCPEVDAIHRVEFPR